MVWRCRGSKLLPCCVHCGLATFGPSPPPLRPAELRCPSDVEVIPDSGRFARAHYSAANVRFHDDSDVATDFAVDYSHTSGSTFNQGETTVQVTATGAMGLSASCSFTVTVLGNVHARALLG